MQYCTKCLMPDTRPGLTFTSDGICSGCVNFVKQSKTDWDKRFKELQDLCDKYRGCNGKGYDCAIAASGGKDSHFQTYIMKEVMGMNPLLLSVGMLEWTETGRKNFDNISEAFSCDIISFDPNRKVSKIMYKKAFEKLGSPTWYVDALVYTFPVKMAMKLGIKLLVYGEDVNFTYGGKFDQETPSALLQFQNDVVKPAWDIWFDDGQISEQELESTKFSPIEEIKNSGLEPIYLSYFVPWNSVHNYDVAKRWGFKHLDHEYQREGWIINYDQVDSISYLLNPYMKYPKFGHSITTDYASRLIRYGLKTREEMIPIVEEKDGELDQGIIDGFCKFTNISHEEFWKIMDKWYNPKLFKRDRDGIWHPKFKVGLGLIN